LRGDDAVTRERGATTETAAEKSKTIHSLAEFQALYYPKPLPPLEYFDEKPAARGGDADG
jgi:hypothetical protein